MNANDIWLIAGLGNPEAKYEGTRHNSGFAALDYLAGKWGISVSKTKFQGLWGQGEVDGHKVVLLKPLTYMNLSGDCVAAAMQWYKVQPQDVMIFSDDIDLELGTLRVRPFGGSGTHNGWRDILLKTGSDRFPRIRIGVGARPTFWNLADWVLSRYQTEEERKAMDACFARAAEAAECFVLHGIDKAMNTYNTKA